MASRVLKLLPKVSSDIKKVLTRRIARTIKMEEEM